VSPRRPPNLLDLAFTAPAFKRGEGVAPWNRKAGHNQFNLFVEGDSAFATYDAVFSTSGRYDVSVDLDEQIGEVDSREASVEITSPTDQRLLGALVPDQEPTIQIIRMPEFEEEPQE